MTTDEALVRELLQVARTVAVEAGRLAHEGRPDDLAVAATKSSPQDVVTEMDLAVEQLLRRRLAALRPDDGVLGEEGDDVAGTSGLTWVVDPIDGTTNYLYGLPAWSVSVAVVRDDGARPDPQTWTVLAGCVHAPADGRTFTAGLGLGAEERLHRDGVLPEHGRTLRVRDAVPLADSLVSTGFGYRAARRAAQARVLTELLPRVRDIRRAGSAALDLCAVAAGRVDLYYERGLQPWDLAAASLVATEAGATVTGLRGRRADSRMVVAGPPGSATALVAVLEEADADADD
ncbi:inositol monophosphatase family protein [Cellulomonas massiliensis]|uniref:inositol monophosphatase family protein n=1 Tax=Cellulomonas massiliensis TaxID=1465811 RepID=UPI0002F6E48F|nr:inositol monophosphatase family protein [Cellulomonas massiliensis]